MTLLLDGDWLLYLGCSANERDVRWTDTIHTLHLDQGDVINTVCTMIEDYRAIADDSDVLVCLSSYPTFRHVEFPDYKANRIGKRKPLGLSDMRKWIADAYPTVVKPMLEADDCMGLLATDGSVPDPIIVSIDKDMRTVPCKLLVNEQIEEVTSLDADRAWMAQTLTGDSTDGYKGVKGVGPVTANKILKDKTTVQEMWPAVVGAYMKAGLLAADAIRTARLARILRAGDYCEQSKQVKLWVPPAAVPA